MNMKKSVNVLGTKYKITMKPKSKDKSLKGFDGYCDFVNKIIVLSDLRKCEEWGNETDDYIAQYQCQVLRHEIVHAFLNESGLNTSSIPVECGWARNEEMVDWIALQGEKVYKAWQEAECL